MKIDVYGLLIDNLTMTEALEKVKEAISKGERLKVYTPNSEFALRAKKDPSFAELINSGDMLVADGIGLIYASRLYKTPLKEKIAGVELTYGILEHLSSIRGKLYIIGGQQEVLDMAISNISKYYSGISFIDGINGYQEFDDELIDRISLTDVDFVLVCLGAGKQEAIIEKLSKRCKGKVYLGGGGTIDIIAGVKKRAPKFFIRLGLEWLHRLLIEPKRFRRYMALPVFGIMVLWDSIIRKGRNKNGAKE